MLTGWRRSATAFVTGAVGALALAPLNFLPAFIVSMVLIVWLIDGCSGEFQSREGSRLRLAFVSAKIGWWFGFGYFLAGLWWLGAAFLVEAEKFAWALPLGVVGLPVILATFTALGFLLSRLFWCSGPGRIFVLSAALGVSEWIRGSVLTGFPWNDFGMVAGGNLVLGQLGSIFGLHGLTFFVIAVAAAPATLADIASPVVGKNKLGMRGYGPTVIACLAVASATLFGVFRLSANPTEYADGARLRLVQPNISQDKKFRPEIGLQVLADYIKLSDRSTSPQSTGIATVTHLFWPESPFPFILSRNAAALAQIGKFLPHGSVLITGAARIDRIPVRGNKKAGKVTRYFNSIQTVESGGLISQTYDKVQLVPFGEYLPLLPIFRAIGLTQFVHIPGGFTAGTKTKPMRLRGIGTIVPLICYEAIFPKMRNTTSGLNDPQKLMVNLTNDGWFGPTTGPYQHLVQARLRSIEEGLPMIRVANTGISAVFDSYGRILHSLPLGVEGVIDSKLPQVAGQTLFATYRWKSPVSVLILFLGLAIFLGRRKST